MSPTPTAPTLPIVSTVGESFPCGTMIELLDDHKLLLYQDGAETIGTTVEYAGTIYEPASLDPALLRALHLPVGTADYVSLDSLAAELADLFRESAAMEESCAHWSAYFVLQTWLRDALPEAVALNLWGAAAGDVAALQLFELLCRHPLHLFEPSLADLSRLPEALAGTVLLDHPSPRVLRPLLGSHRGAHLLRGGRLIDPKCSVVVLSDTPVAGTFSRPLLTVTPTEHDDAISPSTLAARCSALRTKLLRFRLRQFPVAAASDFDLPSLTPALRAVARSYGATVTGSETLRSQLIDALRLADEEAKAESSESIQAWVVEVLMAFCHEARAAITVSELAEPVNALLRSRGEMTTLTPKALGFLLRRQLGLTTRRKEHGYEISLDTSARMRIHRLAQVHAPLSSLHRYPDCDGCARVLPAELNRNVQDVQDVQTDPRKETASEVGMGSARGDLAFPEPCDVQNAQQVQSAKDDQPCQ